MCNDKNNKKEYSKSIYFIIINLQNGVFKSDPESIDTDIMTVHRCPRRARAHTHTHVRARADTHTHTHMYAISDQANKVEVKIQ